MGPEKYQFKQKRPVFDKGDFNSSTQKLSENRNIKIAKTVAIAAYHEKSHFLRVFAEGERKT